MAITNTAAALREFAETFSRWDTAGDIATVLSCGEIEAMAGLLRVVGEEDAADRWIRVHAETDEEGDAHYVEGEGTRS